MTIKTKREDRITRSERDGRAGSLLSQDVGRSCGLRESRASEKKVRSLSIGRLG